MAKGKKISMINIIVLAVLVVCLVLAIVGLSVDKWTDVKVNEDIQDSIFGGVAEGMTEDAGSSFGDLVEMVTDDEFKTAMEKYKAMIDEAKEAGLEGEALEALEAPYKASQEYVAIVAFGLITVLLLAVAVVVAVLNLFVNIGFLRFIVLVAGILALVAGIIAVALTGDVIALSEDLGDIADATVKPVIGAGAALLAVGGILGGIASVAGFFLGKKK